MKIAVWVLAALVGVSTFCARAQDANVLTDAEKKDGWRLLFDGKSTEGWVTVKGTGEFPDHGWTIKDGVLTVKAVQGRNRTAAAISSRRKSIRASR